MKKKYDIYLDGIWFFKREATSVQNAVQLTKEQIENLHPLNYSEANLETYRDRFRNRKIEAFVEYSNDNPYTKK